MKYCVRCVYPSTKPGLTFNEAGVCSACLAYESRSNIDWDQRSVEFRELVDVTKKYNLYSPYDCIVPVSGGKDSHYQVIKALEYGLNPLAVTATTDDLSDIGARNLANISKLGVDHIHITTNSKIRRRINKYTLETVGDISWAEHVTIFTVPVREAILRSIPLIIWGENPQNEYGGPNQRSIDSFELDDKWLQEFGGLNSLRVDDIIDQGIATERGMFQYTSPYDSDAEANPVPPKGIFLGQYFPWNGFENALLANKNGFEMYHRVVEGTGVTYENLDNYQTGIHDYFKYIKFGFGRATDIACNYIRRGYMTRKQAIAFVKKYESTYPSTYLGKSIQDILKHINMSEYEFIGTCDKFTNRDLFYGNGSVLAPKFTIE